MSHLFLRRFLACGIVLYAQAIGLLLPASSAEPVKRILLIGKQPDHPYGTHVYLPTCRLLAACLNQHPSVDAIVSDGWPKAGTNWDPEQPLAAIVLYRSPFAKEMFEGPHAAKIRQHLDRGTGLVTLHWSTGILPENYDRLESQMTRYLGGTWKSDSKQVAMGESQLTLLNPDHPIQRGVTLKSIRDEWYFNPQLSPQAKPLWSVTARDKPLTVAWTYERTSGGRSFATTLGHFWHNYAEAPFRRALVNGILWTAHVEVPAKGSPIELPEPLLSLPP